MTIHLPAFGPANIVPTHKPTLTPALPPVIPDITCDAEDEALGRCLMPPRHAGHHRSRWADNQFEASWKTPDTKPVLIVPV